MAVRTTRIECPRAARPVISPSLGPGPKPAPMYRPVATPLKTTPATRRPGPCSHRRRLVEEGQGGIDHQADHERIADGSDPGALPERDPEQQEHQTRRRSPPSPARRRAAWTVPDETHPRGQGRDPKQRSSRSSRRTRTQPEIEIETAGARAFRAEGKLVTSPNLRARRLAARSSHRTGSDRGFLKIRPDGASASASRASTGPHLQSRLEGGLGLQPGQVDSDASVRALRKGEVRSGIGPRKIELVRIGERRRVTVGGTQRDDDEIAFADRVAAQFGVLGGVSIDPAGGRFQPQRLLDRRGRQRPIGRGAAQLIGIGQQVPEQGRGHSLAGFDAPEQHHRCVGDDLGGRQRWRWPATGPRRPSAIVRATSLGEGLECRPARRPRPRLPPTPDRPPPRFRRTSRGPWRDRRRCRSRAAATTLTASGPARSRRISAVPRRRQRRDHRPCLAGDVLGEALPNLGEAKGGGERDRDGGGGRPRRATTCSDPPPGRSRTADHRQ